MFCRPSTAPEGGKGRFWTFGVLHATQLIGHAARLLYLCSAMQIATVQSTHIAELWARWGKTGRENNNALVA